MTLQECRETLGLGLTATRQEIKSAYRRAARRWHPDKAPVGQEAVYRAHMQEINAAYQQLLKFLEIYRYRLEETEAEPDLEAWWRERFATGGVWGRPPREPQDE